MDNIIEFVAEFNRPNINFVIGKMALQDFKIGSRCTHFAEDNLFDITHEVAHLIQLNDDELQRCYVNNNGVLRFNYPYIEVCNQIVCEPSTDQISMRELETFIIQYYIMNDYETIDYIDWLDKHDIIGLFGWMPDSYIFSNGKKLTNDYVFQKSGVFLEKWNLTNVKERWFSLKLKSEIV